MLNLKDIDWGEPIKATPIENDFFDEMFGVETLELTEENIKDLVKGRTLYVIVECEYTILIRLKGASNERIISQRN